MVIANKSIVKLFQLQKDIKMAIAQAKGKKTLLTKCTALVPLTSFISLTDPTFTQNPVPVMSLDGQVKCMSKGAETQDYPACVKLKNAWDGFLIAKKAMGSIQKYENRGVPFSSWLFRIAKSELNQSYREKKVKRTVSIDNIKLSEMMASCSLNKGSNTPPLASNAAAYKMVSSVP